MGTIWGLMSDEEGWPMYLEEAIHFRDEDKYNKDDINLVAAVHARCST
jgi:hypothetical protein